MGNNLSGHYDRFRGCGGFNDIDNIFIDNDVIPCFNGLPFCYPRSNTGQQATAKVETTWPVQETD
jgi:hypothetical protein